MDFEIIRTIETDHLYDRVFRFATGGVIHPPKPVYPATPAWVGGPGGPVPPFRHSYERNPAPWRGPTPDMIILDKITDLKLTQSRVTTPESTDLIAGLKEARGSFTGRFDVGVIKQYFLGGSGA